MVIQCGNGFYDKHKEKIKEMTDKISKSCNDERVIKDYIQNFFDHFNGGRNCTALTGNVDSYFIEQTEQKRNLAEEIISNITGKEPEDLKLIDLEIIKQGLENRKKELEKQFQKEIESISKEEK